MGSDFWIIKKTSGKNTKNFDFDIDFNNAIWISRYCFWQKGVSLMR
jgi:hypothetical protein